MWPHKVADGSDAGSRLKSGLSRNAAQEIYLRGGRPLAADQALQVLERVFGLHSFRGFQKEVIDAVSAGRDVLVLMPTGGGKSLCYQLPALLRDGVAVVISPLIALMADQVASLEEIGVSAAYLNSTQTPEQSAEVKRRIVDGDVKLLYVAPERLVTDGMIELFDNIPLALFAIDEAHCVSMWGHDFRPEYGKLALLRERWPDVPRIALTATADINTREEICARLLHDPLRFVASFDRPNIHYRIVEKVDPQKQLVDFIKNEHAGEAGIVYCLARNTTHTVEELLNRHGIRAIAYHAGIDGEERIRRQQTFLREDGVVMVATVAFGMGIDKPDVRFVAHYDMPKSIENYFQETGRAGRDGLPSEAWMMYGLQDVMNQMRFIEKSPADDVYKRRSTVKLDAMLALAETVGCRRKMILQYFGESSESCGNCDNCQQPPQTIDATIAAKKLLSCIWRCAKASGRGWGARHIFDVLLGERTERVLANGHDKLTTFGIGEELDINGWRRLLRQLIARGVVIVDSEHFNILVLGDAEGILKNGETVTMRVIDQVAKRRKKIRAAEEELEEDDQRLFERLRGWRREMAAETGKPPYRIFPDATLRNIARERPKTLGYLGSLPGIGEAKLDHYGEEVIAIVKDYESEEVG